MQECIEELIREKINEGKERTAGNYQSAWNKLSSYLGDKTSQFTFDDLTTEFLQHYLLWLMQSEKYDHTTLRASSLDFYIRTLKAMYNKIVATKQIRLPDGSPFSSLQIKVPPSRK